MNISLLNNAHIRKEFLCEEPSLTDYIRQQVRQDIKKKLAVCFVAVDTNQKVKGYYTLSSESLGRESVPEKYLQKIPKNYNVPVILIGRLARDLQTKGTGLGEHLLMDALYRSFVLSEKSIGAIAVVVDPIHEKAVKFYERYGFITLPDSEKMFLPMQMIRQLF